MSACERCAAADARATAAEQELAKLRELRTADARTAANWRDRAKRNLEALKLAQAERGCPFPTSAVPNGHTWTTLCGQTPRQEARCDCGAFAWETPAA